MAAPVCTGWYGRMNAVINRLIAMVEGTFQPVGLAWARTAIDLHLPVVSQGARAMRTNHPFQEIRITTANVNDVALTPEYINATASLLTFPNHSRPGGGFFLPFLLRFGAGLSRNS